MRFLLTFMVLLAASPVRAQLRPHDAEAVAAAAAGGNTAELSALLNAGGPINERNAHGWTPLICALSERKTEAAKLLLTRHADPNGLSRKGCSPLDFALMSDCDDLIPPLLDAGADVNGFRVPDSNGETCSPLCLALEHHRLAALKLLVARGARLEDASNEGNTALMSGCRRDGLDLIAFLVGQGANVNARDPRGHTALIYAAYNGRDEIVKFLLAHGADVHASATNGDDGRLYGPWEAASEQGRPYILETLADAGATTANPRQALNDELNQAVDFDDYERAQAALAKGASASEPDSSGVFPLTVAVLNGNSGLVAMLIKAGADVRATTGGDRPATTLEDAMSQMESAKDPAAKERFRRVAELLRKAGAAR